MKQTTGFEKTSYRLHLALAVALSFLSNRSAAAKHVPNARPGGMAHPSSDLGPPALSTARARSAAADASARRGKAASPLDVRDGRNDMSSGSQDGPGANEAIVIDNHSININDPSKAGPGSPAHPKSFPVIGPTEANTPLIRIKGISQFVYYLPFSSGFFPTDTNHNTKQAFGFGLYIPPYSSGSSGSLPQSSEPLGVPVAPDAPTVDAAQVRESVVRLVSQLDTPVADKEPAARLLQESIQKRDVRDADKHLPRLSASSTKPSAASSKPQG